MRLSNFRSLGIHIVGVLVVVGCGTTKTRPTFEPEPPPTETPPDDQVPGKSSSGELPPAGLTVDPANWVIKIDSATTPITKATVTYKLTAQDGSDVSQAATLEVDDPALGTFAGPTFTSAESLPGDEIGVSTIVKATSPSGAGLARLTIVKLKLTGAHRDFFFSVPYQQEPDPKRDTLEFSTKIRQVDVAFAMDTTGSMSSQINNLKGALAGTLLTQLQSVIPNVGMALVDYKDYPTGGYGGTGDFPVKVLQTMTTSLPLAQAAVNLYNASGGSDGPEAQIPAMQHILTGEYLGWDTGYVPFVEPSPGHFGAVDFRPGSVPVVVNMTDVTWHDDLTPAGNPSPYSFGPTYGTPTLASLKTAFTSHHAFFVDITTSFGDEAQADELSDATSSNVPPDAFGSTCPTGMCCTGLGLSPRAPTGPGGNCRLNFKMDTTDVSSGIVKAIDAISMGASYDVKAVVSNDPNNANGVDATKFIQSMRAVEEGDPTKDCLALPAMDSDGDGIKETFINVKVGTKVCFEVVPAMNTTVVPTELPQFYNAIVDVIGVQNNVPLDHRSVLFLVPPKDAHDPT